MSDKAREAGLAAAVAEWEELKAPRSSRQLFPGPIVRAALDAALAVKEAESAALREEVDSLRSLLKQAGEALACARNRLDTIRETHPTIALDSDIGLCDSALSALRSSGVIP